MMTAEAYQQEADAIRPQLVAEARRYLDGDEAEDVVQDTLLRLWGMCDDLHSPMQPLASVIVRRLCIDRLRRKPLTTDADNIQQYDDAATDQTAVERMMQVIATLPTLQQTILRLRHIEGMEMGEIASTMSMTEVAVRKALSRARLAVRAKYLKNYGKL